MNSSTSNLLDLMDAWLNASTSLEEFEQRRRFLGDYLLYREPPKNLLAKEITKQIKYCTYMGMDGSVHRELFHFLYPLFLVGCGPSPSECKDMCGKDGVSSLETSRSCVCKGRFVL